MKILYGVQTTGNGHLVRARSMIDKLRRKGHDIHTLFSGDIHKSIPDPQFFQPYTFKRGLTFYTDRGKLKYGQTIKNLRLFRFYSDIISFKPRDFDVVITDYEPITARIAKKEKITSIGIGHLYSFCYNIPIKKGYPFSLLLMNNFAPVDIPVGLHWHHFEQPILPPSIPEDIHPATTQKDKIVVYLAFENLEQVQKVLLNFPRKTFYIYSRVDKEYDHKNLKIRSFNRENFVRDLAESEGVICNAGFSLLSEASHLGKKILAKPLNGQIEQESNALALEELGLGTVTHDLQPEDIQEWMNSSPPQPQSYPDVFEELADWIDKGDWNDLFGLSNRLWR